MRSHLLLPFSTGVISRSGDTTAVDSQVKMVISISSLAYVTGVNRSTVTTSGDPMVGLSTTATSDGCSDTVSSTSISSWQATCAAVTLQLERRTNLRLSISKTTH